MADQCHYPELHLEDKGSVAFELMLSGARKKKRRFGLPWICQRTQRVFPAEVHSQSKSYKSTNDCDKTCNIQNCLSCPVK